MSCASGEFAVKSFCSFSFQRLRNPLNFFLQKCAKNISFMFIGANEIRYWADRESAQRVDQRVQKGLFLFASTNSTVNPIVYGLFHVKAMCGRVGQRRARVCK